MHTEIDMVIGQHKKHDVPVREEPPKGAVATELTSRRRVIRTEVDDCIRAGLLTGDVVEFAIRLARVGFCVAGACVQFGSEPTGDDFNLAAREALEEAQRRLDKALMTGDWAGVRRAAMQFEFVWYGISTTISLPWFDVLGYLNDRYVDGEPVEPEKVAELLRRAGIQVTPTAANDEPPPLPPKGPRSVA